MRQVFEYHPTLGYRYIPHLHARVPHEGGGYLFQTNGLGFRCQHEFSSVRGSKRRILLFGDSFTAGEGVSDGQRYGDLLEKKIPDIEVFNFGLPGTGTDQHYLTYLEYAKELPCDLMIIAVFVDNIRRVTARYRVYLNDRGERVCYAKPYFELAENDDLLLRGVPPSREPISEAAVARRDRSHVDKGGRYPFLRKVLVKSKLKALSQRITRYQPLPEFDHPNHASWLMMRAVLAKWIEKQRGSVLLMPIPQYQYIEGLSDSKPYQTRFQEISDEKGVFLHDPLPDLLRFGLEDRRRFRFQTDGHMTPQGHAALADSMVSTVENILSKNKTRI